MTTPSSPLSNLMSEPPDSTPPGTARKAVLAVLRLALFGAILFLIWRYWDHAAFHEWKQEAGPVPFFAALAILPAIGVPTTPFYLIAGAAFGIFTGLIGSMIALALNLALCFWIARGPLRSLLERSMEKTKKELPSVEKSGAWRFTLLVKFMPGVPAFIKHYLIVLAGVPARIYFPASLFISGFYAAAFVVLGESAHDQDFGTTMITLAVIGLVTAFVWWLRKRKRRG